MAGDATFCAIYKPPLLEKCMTMAEWSATWQSIGLLVTLFVAICAAVKYFLDKAATREQAKKAHGLERVKFFLEQHRRLFDDDDLKRVLRHLDGDDIELAEEENWEAKRKFAVFIEEVELLIRSGMLDADACQYMFGYYAHCAYDGKNFKIGIDLQEEYWALFFDFAKEYPEFKKRMKSSNGWRFTL